MNESKILRIISDEKWYAQAYGEYLADVAESVSNLMGAIQESLGIDQEEELDTSTIDEILNRHGINPQARFIVPEFGPLSTRDLVSYLWGKTGDDNYQLGATGLSIGVDELCSTIRGTWTQAAISSKAFLSYTGDVSNAIERGTKFIQDLQSEFALDDTVRETFSIYQGMISKNPSVSDFLESFLKMSGIDDMADNEVDELSYYNSDLTNYTGNTPALALDFSTVNKAVNTTVKVAAKVVKGVFNAISKGATWLFNKAKKYIVDTIVDPAIAEYIDNGNANEGYLDGFAWFGEFVPNATLSHFITGGQISQIFSGFSDEYASSWIKLKLKTGELLFKIVEDTKWQAYFKPIAMDVNYLSSSISNLTRPPNYQGAAHENSINAFVTWLEGISPYIQPLGKDANKYQLAAGFACATKLTQVIAQAALYETYYLVKGSQIQSSGSITYNTVRLDWNDYLNLDEEIMNITNADLVTVASGDPSSNQNIKGYVTFNNLTGPTYSNSIAGMSMQATITDLMSVWALCRLERRDDPLNYTFVPYSNNHSGFTPSSWKVKSDATIAATRDNFITNAIIAAVVIVIVIAVGITVTKISKTLFFKRQQTIGQLENKMWQGESLTASEKRKYLRANRRQAASKMLSSGTQDSSFSLTNDTSNIMTLIKG